MTQANQPALPEPNAFLLCPLCQRSLFDSTSTAAVLREVLEEVNKRHKANEDNYQMYSREMRDDISQEGFESEYRGARVELERVRAIVAKRLEG